MIKEINAKVNLMYFLLSFRRYVEETIGSGRVPVGFGGPPVGCRGNDTYVVDASRAAAPTDVPGNQAQKAWAVAVVADIWVCCVIA